tara:strand:- start:526 stop:1500 length:975 start_codon:yes stop_codon:yes gene_type:complete
MTHKDLHIINSLLERTENLPDILYLRAAPLGYHLTQEDKELLLDTYQKLDDILKEVAAFINVKFPGRQDYIQPWNDIDFDTKIGGLKVITTDREHVKSAWKKGIFDLKSLIKSLANEVTLLVENKRVISNQMEEKKLSKKNYYLKEISIGIIITVLGGMILNLILNPKAIFQTKKHYTETRFQKPNISIENYKLKALNETSRNLDTVSVRFKYQGSKIILNSNFKLIDYNFYEQQYFYLGNRNEFNPELELIEVMLTNPILDSLNNESEIKIELKRRLIFDGHKMAYFEENDKEQIGNFRLAFNYNYDDRIIKDTITSGIYIVK